MKQTAYELACAKLNMQPATIDNFAHEMEDDRTMCFGEHKFRTCIKAENIDEHGKPFNPDWKNWNQEKWRNWYEAKKATDRASGVGFWFGGSGCGHSDSCVGSRLHSRNSEIAERIGNNSEITEYFNEWTGV